MSLHAAVLFAHVLASVVLLGHSLLTPLVLYMAVQPFVIHSAVMRGIVDLSRARVGAYVDWAATWPPPARGRANAKAPPVPPDHLVMA